MDLQLHGTTVLVTGAGQGLGRAIGTAFAAEGAGVAFLHHSSSAGADEAAAEVRSAGGRAISVGADLRDRDAVESAAARVADELGPIGVLVNNAAATQSKPFLETDPDDWAPQIDVTVAGTLRIMPRRRQADGRPRRRVDRQPHGRLGPGGRVAGCSSPPPPAPRPSG